MPTVYRTPVSGAREHATECSFVQRLPHCLPRSRGGWEVEVLPSNCGRVSPVWQWAGVPALGITWLWFLTLKHCPLSWSQQMDDTWYLAMPLEDLGCGVWTAASRAGAGETPLIPQHLWGEVKGQGKIFKKEPTSLVGRWEKHVVSGSAFAHLIK